MYICKERGSYIKGRVTFRVTQVVILDPRSQIVKMLSLLIEVFELCGKL